MPYFASDTEDSASSELMQAGGSAFLAFMVTPWGAKAGIGALKYGAKGAWWGVKTGAKAVKTVSAPLGRGVLKAFDRTAVPVGKGVGKQVFQTGKQAVGGTIKAGLSAASWVYQHPIMAPLAAGALGAGLASVSSKSANSGVNAYSATDVMGGTSNTSMLMNELNASGNIVFGLHNRR